MLFCGKTICGKAWYTIHGLSKASFHRYKSSYEQGARKARHGNIGIIQRAWDHVEIAKAIIQDYVDKNAEIMPHRSRTTFEGDRENHHVLVGVYKQQDILREVNIMLTSSGFKMISHSTLSRLWRTIFKQVSLCKSSSFSKCDICTSIPKWYKIVQICSWKRENTCLHKIHVEICTILGSKRLVVNLVSMCALFMIKWIK